MARAGKVADYSAYPAAHHAVWRTGSYVPGTVQLAHATDLSFTRHGRTLVAVEAR